MIENQASRTSDRAALHRAAHQILDHPPVFRDELALQVIGLEARAALEANPRCLERGRWSPRLRAFLAVRSRVAEDALAEAVAGGVRQYVVLGAGLDTFGLRNQIPALRVLEVDHPTTQERKRRRIQEARLTVPPTLSFVALNLARENLAPALLAAGLEPDQPAFFAWLGVTPYLDAGTVWKTLRGVADLSGPTGGIVFDYAVPAERLGLVERVLAAGLAARVSAVGEPFRSYLRPEELATGLRALGFGSCEDLDAEMLNTRYFSRRADGLRVGGAAHIMVARSVRPSQIH